MLYSQKSFKKLLLSGSVILVLAVGTTVSIACSSFFPSAKETIYQISTYDALSKGGYEGLTSLKSAAKYGDMGIGTFEGLDGEMVYLDGNMYQIKADGKAYFKNKADLSKELTPYIVTTSFEADIKEQLNASQNYQELQNLINTKIENKNLFYAIKIKGTFSNIKVRSVPKQQTPYPSLTDALKNQTVFDYNNIEGTLVGFWCPAYVGGVNVPGFHLHFISKDRSVGGHVLDVQVQDAQLNMDKTRAFNMVLPDSK